MGSRAVLCSDSRFICCFWHCINRLPVYLTFLLTPFLTYLLLYRFTSLRIGPFHFQARFRKEETKPGFGVLYLLCCSVFGHVHMVAFVVFDITFQCLAERLAGKNVSRLRVSPPSEGLP